MASFLDSIGYNLWVLPALLAIPLIGAVILLLLPVREPAGGEGVETPAQRLRPARPSDLPDAPRLGATEQATLTLPGVNLAPPAPMPAPPQAAPAPH